MNTEAKFEALHLTFDSVLQSSTWRNDWAFRVTNPKWSSSRFQWKPAKCQVTEIKDGSLTSKRPAETRSEPEARCTKATSSATFDDQSHCRHRFLSWQTTCVGVVLDHILQDIHGRLILRMQLTHQPPRFFGLCYKLYQATLTATNFYHQSSHVFSCLSMSLRSLPLWSSPLPAPSTQHQLRRWWPRPPRHRSHSLWRKVFNEQKWTNNIFVSLHMTKHETSTDHEKSNICFGERICTRVMGTSVHTLYLHIMLWKRVAKNANWNF